MDSTDLLPVGRRVAYWRGRRKLSQQVFADRLGKSKSWVDKVERGVRALDRVSTLQEIAAYRIAPPVVDDGDPAELSLCGTLLVQAALAAARNGDDRTAVELLDEAAGMAARVDDGRDLHRTGFGPTAVQLARLAREPAAPTTLIQLAATLGVG